MLLANIMQTAQTSIVFRGNRCPPPHMLEISLAPRPWCFFVNFTLLFIQYYLISYSWSHLFSFTSRSSLLELSLPQNSEVWVINYRCRISHLKFLWLYWPQTDHLLISHKYLPKFSPSTHLFQHSCFWIAASSLGFLQSVLYFIWILGWMKN